MLDAPASGLRYPEVQDYARQLVDDLGAPESVRSHDAWLLQHIDYGSIARDLELGRRRHYRAEAGWRCVAVCE